MLMELTMEANEIYSVLKSNSIEQISALIKDAPRSSFKDHAMSMAESENLGLLIVGLTNMVMEYCYGRNPEYGVNLADAAHKVALETYQQHDDHGGLLLTTLSNLASQHMNGLNRLGRLEEAIVAADIYLPLYRSFKEMENYPSIGVAKANALFNLNRINECKALLSDIDFSQSPGAKIERDRLYNLINDFGEKVVEVKRKAKTTTMRESLQSIFSGR